MSDKVYTTYVPLASYMINLKLSKSLSENLWADCETMLGLFVFLVRYHYYINRIRLLPFESTSSFFSIYSILIIRGKNGVINSKVGTRACDDSQSKYIGINM